MTRRLLALGLAACAQAHAGDWTGLDYGMQAAASALIVENYLIARETVRDGYEIYSPAYHRVIQVDGDALDCSHAHVHAHTAAPEPSMGRENLCYGAFLAGQAALAAALPHRYRWLQESITIGQEQWYVREQHRIGLRYVMRF